MEAEMSSRRGKKRMLVECDDEDNKKVYEFKILIPNGVSVGLKLRNPVLEMPFREFVGLIREEYSAAVKASTSMKRRRVVNWKDDRLFLRDENGAELRNVVKFKNFERNERHFLWLHDGSGESVQNFENMWDLTPDTELLKELPEEYNFETALADLIDNSLQAVWSNDENDRKFISVDVNKKGISIFDTGPGMDGSEKNSIVKWGKMGASLHRRLRKHAIGGRAPFLMPYFGMFGYGGPIASMHLGRRTLVSSKTKISKKVYTLHLAKEALVSNSGSEHNWKTDGGIRDPCKDEIESSPHGSFTKVEIFEPAISSMDISQFQCWLKDIYFPYIQCDETSSTGKTNTPVEFQVNGTDLAEIQGGEVAITNLHSSNGPDFVVQLHFSFEESVPKSSGSRSRLEANARLKFVYFPVVEGKENIEMILDDLKEGGFPITEHFETFSHVSVRRLGRLLPDARWAWLPFMDLKHKKGDKAHSLKRCCMRVKCFIETDAGFKPTPSKTDLAHQNPFTIALKNLGNNLTTEREKGILMEIYRGGKLLTLPQLEKEYQDWIIQMHNKYDTEVDHGEDKPTILVSPVKGKSGISADVVRVHRVLKRNGVTWKSGQRIKLLKGACAGVHKNNVYATLEYFLIEGFQGDVGGEARIICRPLSIPDEEGCVLREHDGEANLEIRKSLSVPVSVIDSQKCLAVESNEWNIQVEKQRQKSPSTIDLLSAEQCQELEVDGGELPAVANAGKVPPKEIVAVVRPANYNSSPASKSLDQKFIIKDNLEMSLEVKFSEDGKNFTNAQHVYSTRVTPSSYSGVQGVYVFPIRSNLSDWFQKAGVYAFSFSLTNSSCKGFVKRVEINASPEIERWKLISDDQSLPYCATVGSSCETLSIACYDKYGNQTSFTSNPKVVVKIRTSKAVPFHVKQLKTVLYSSKSILEVKEFLIESSDLDKIRPSYEATLFICTSDKLFSVSVPCHVFPGCLQRVRAQPQAQESNLLPGCIIKNLKLEMFDGYGNHVKKGLEVQLDVVGFQILDQLGLKRKVDDHGFIDLSSLLKVTAGYGKIASLSVLSDKKVFLKQEFQIKRSELRLVSMVPEFPTAGSILQNLVFEVVDSDGVIDDTIHDEEKNGQSHMLMVKAEPLSTEENIRYAFKHGRCTVPAIFLPQKGGIVSFIACHSRHSDLSLSFKVNVLKPPKAERDGFQYPCSDENFLDFPLLEPVENNYQDNVTQTPNAMRNTIQSPYTSKKFLHLQTPSSSLEPVKNLIVSMENEKMDNVMQTSNAIRDEFQSPHMSKKALQLQSSPSLKPVENLIAAMENKKRKLEIDVDKFATLVGDLERQMERYYEKQMEIEQSMKDLQDSTGLSLLNDVSTKEELMEEIESIDHSVAAVLCNISRRFPFREPQHPLMRDIIGLVALLGSVRFSKLSRVLSEYLGLDQMLAVVTISFAAAQDLEKYDQNGDLVSRQAALYPEVSALGKSINGRFLVIPLEDISPFKNGFENGPQRKLSLPAPNMDDGCIPPGFIGFAVNMIELDSDHLRVNTTNGHGLRETLFYSLFGKLQVYRTRKDMLAARACIKNGAVSMDGGILKENGSISVGLGDPGIYFRVIPEKSEMLVSQESKENMKRIRELKSESKKINKEMDKLLKEHEKTNVKLKRKRMKYVKLLDEMDPVKHYYLECGSCSTNISDFSPF
ncbi:hypothetical protein UlMin_024338 [Ulmus minor]